MLGMRSDAKAVKEDRRTWLSMYPKRSIHTNVITSGQIHTISQNELEPDLSMGSGIGEGNGVTVPYINTIYRRPHTSLGFASTTGRRPNSRGYKEIQERENSAKDRVKLAFQFYDASSDPKEKTMHEMYVRTIEGKLHNAQRRGILS